MKVNVIPILIFLSVLALIGYFTWWFLKSPDTIVETLQNWLNTPKGYIAIGCLMLIFGVALFSVGIYKQIEYQNFKKHGVSVQGVISSIESKRDGKNTSHNVYVTFTAEGNEYTFKSHYYSSEMNQGDNLPVLYYPNNPDKAMVVKGSAFVVIFCIAAGLILVFSGFALLRTYKMYIP
jgi:hypothetical protein